MGKAQDTKTHIIEQAALVFNKHGYERTSMSKLTRAINMTKGAIYGNFKDKDEIALSAFDHNFSKLSTDIAKTTNAKEHTCDKLVAFAQFYLNQFQKMSQDGGCPILNAAIDSDNSHTPLKEKVCEAIDLWMGHVAGIVYDGIKKDEIHSHTKPEQFASIFVSLIEGGFMLSKVLDNPIYLSRNVDHIIHLVNMELRI
ncbi:MAG: TetR/AcrR family transcriptional regulator [Desulfobacterales bacterium]|nr:TetR/AcrR family transcriptional regulator [Desulfobacterales bacterium]